MLEQELRGLLEKAGDRPSAADLRAFFAPRARAITSAGPQLVRAPWARGVHGADDVFVELDDDLAGVRLWDDARGFGTYAQLTVTRGAVSEVESVLGPLQRAPRLSDGAGSLETLGAFPRPGVRVLVDHEQGAVRYVTVHFARTA